MRWRITFDDGSVQLVESDNESSARIVALVAAMRAKAFELGVAHGREVPFDEAVNATPRILKSEPA